MASKFPGSPEVKNPPSNAGDKGSSLGWGSKIPTFHRQQLLFLCCWEPEGTTSCRRDGVKGPCQEASNRGRGPEPSWIKAAPSAQPLSHPPAQLSTSDYQWKHWKATERGWVSLTELWANKKATVKATRVWGQFTVLWNMKKKTNKHKDLGLTIQKNGGSINQMEWQLVNRLGGKSWVERFKSYCF